MRTPQPATLLAVALSITSARAAAYDGSMMLCYDKGLQGKCTNRGFTWGGCVNFGNDKYADKGSSLKIPVGTRCRLFNNEAPDGCQDPGFKNGKPGAEGRRATGWLDGGDYIDIYYPFTAKSYACFSAINYPADIVVADCDDEPFGNTCG